MAEDEKKLGPSVVYTNPDKSAKLVQVAGVLFKEGESVNLVEKLGQQRAEPILKKLANNRYFKVDGGPDHSQEQQASGVVEEPAGTHPAIAQEQRLREREGDEAADKYVESLDENGQPKQQQQQGQSSYQPPEEATLEQQPQPASRRPRG